jgi:hypothetical protein
LELTTKQTTALDYLQDDTTKEVLFGGGAGGAKSHLGCVWLVVNCFEYPGTRWVMGRSELKSLKETTLNTFFEVCSMMGLQSGKHYQYNSVSGFIQIGESQILLKDLKHYPSDPNYDSLGSLEITGAFIDECNQLNIKAKEVLKSRIRYKLDDYGLLPKILMTCNPAKNWVYTDFYKPWKDNTLPTEKKFVQALATDNPYISKHYIDNLRTLDKNSQERLLHGNWEYDNDPAKLFEYESLTDMFTNEHAEAGKKYLTVDVARFGQDKTVIIEWDGLRATNIRIIQQNSIESLVNEIKDISRVQSIPRSAILVDEDGVGGGVVDFLKCKGFVNGSKAIKERGRDTNFSNLKSQCYFKLAEYVNNSKIFVSCIQDVKELLIEELEVVKAKDIDKDNKLAVEGKDKVKDLLGRSPDISDALMMRMYFEINKTTTRW